jgi:hypothetical protein
MKEPLYGTAEFFEHRALKIAGDKIAALDRAWRAEFMVKMLRERIEAGASNEDLRAMLRLMDEYYK